MVRKPATRKVRAIGFRPNVIKPPQFLGLSPVFWVNCLLAVIALIVFIVYPDSVNIEEPKINFNPTDKTSSWTTEQNNIKRLQHQAENASIDIKPIITRLLEEELPGAFKAIRKSTVCVLPMYMKKDANENEVPVPGGVFSGVFYTPSGKTGNPGYIITTFEAVNGMEYCEVAMYDRQVVRAEIVGGDLLSNIGVLKLSDSQWKNRSAFAPIKIAKNVTQGDLVCNCGGTDEWGYWGGEVDLQFSFLRGVLSSAKRHHTMSLGNGQQAGKSCYFYQVTSPIGPGVSGGPTINTKAEVIGINMDFIYPDEVEQEFGYTFPYVRGMNFVLPINYATKIADSIVNKGCVDRAYMGVDFQILTNNDNSQNLIISYVEPGSPAANSGIIAGDELLMIGPSPCVAKVKDDLPEIWMMIANLKVGTDVSVKIKRDGKEKTFSVKPEMMSTSEEYEVNCDSWGVSLKPLTKREMSKRGVQSSKGFFISSISNTGRATEAGLRAGDIIVSIDGNTPQTKEELQALYEKISSDRKNNFVLFKVLRSGYDRFFIVKNQKKVDSIQMEEN